MTRPFPLQTVLELMQVRADDATQQLAKLIANERDARSKLDLLQQYRDEYAGRFRDAAQNGLTRIQWQNYQEFLNRLDEAIAQQNQTVAQQERNTASGQMNWRQQQKNLKAFDTLSDRHVSRETMREIKRDQKAQDEFASRPKDSDANKTS